MQCIFTLYAYSANVLKVVFVFCFLFAGKIHTHEFPLPTVLSSRANQKPSTWDSSLRTPGLVVVRGGYTESDIIFRFPVLLYRGWVEKYMRLEFENAIGWIKRILHQVRIPIFYFISCIKSGAFYRALNLFCSKMPPFFNRIWSLVSKTQLWHGRMVALYQVITTIF